MDLREHIGVCLDTCHVWDAGYDIAADLEGVLAEFDRVIGLERLHAVHLNNSLNPCGSRKDRHAELLEGRIPQEAQGDHAPASLNESVAQLAGRLRDNLKGKLENTIGGSGNSGDEVTNLA